MLTGLSRCAHHRRVVDTEELVELVKVRELVRTGRAKSIRLRAGLSLGEVAAALGTGPSTIWRWESGDRLPRGRRAVRYGALLAQLGRRR